MSEPIEDFLEVDQPIPRSKLCSSIICFSRICYSAKRTFLSKTFSRINIPKRSFC